MFEDQLKFNLSNDKKFVVWLSHDVDRVYKRPSQCLYLAAKQRALRHVTDMFLKESPYWTFHSIMDLENKYNVRSTFFFLNESIRPNLFRPKSFILALGRYSFDDPKVRQIIKDIDAKGWEVGLHGSYRSYQNCELLRREKTALEQILGREVAGIRQHYLNLDIPKTWDIQHSVGLKYDASFGLKQSVGYREGVFYPFRPFKNAFTVFPLTIMDTYLHQQYKSWEAVWDECLRVIKTAESKQTLLSVLWHQQVFYERDYPGYRQLYERVIQECVARKAIFCTGKDIFDYVEPAAS